MMLNVKYTCTQGVAQIEVFKPAIEDDFRFKWDEQVACLHTQGQVAPSHPVLTSSYHHNA